MAVAFAAGREREGRVDVVGMTVEQRVFADPASWLATPMAHVPIDFARAPTVQKGQTELA